MTGKKVILIMTDSTRYDMLGCYGNEDMKTPHLDRMAREGLRFERAYSCQPVCCPARAAIFTGQYPHSCGAFTNSYALGDNVRTIGKRLSDAGIHTAFIGKYHLDGGDYFGLGRCPDGWDAAYWYDMRSYLEELTPGERVLSRQVKRDRSGVTAGDTFGHRVADRAVDFLKRHGDEDFFLTASLDEPHGPFLCPEPYASMYEGYQFPKYPNVWDTLEGKPQYQKLWAGEERFADRDRTDMSWPLFFGCNSFADSEIGRILEAAEEYAGDALIIYTSDHGDAFHSHCLYAKGPAAYDEIARVPLIVKGGAARGVVGTAVSHISLAPTVMEYLGVKPPKVFEGRSILPVLEDAEADIGGDVFIEFTRYEADHDGFGGFRPMRTVFDGRFKLSVHLLDPVDELYDMEKDPYELDNLIGREEYYGTARRLHERLLDWMNDTRDPFRGWDWELRPWRRRDTRPASWAYTGYTRQREDEDYEPRQLDYATGLEMESAVRKK